MDENTLINVASDVSMNSVEGEVKLPLLSGVSSKFNFVVSNCFHENLTIIIILCLAGRAKSIIRRL
jgi:hypothetical protein